MSESKTLQKVQEHKQSVPKWLPVSLLALTTIALTVPAALLWRQKRALRLSKFLSNSAPPLRRAASLPKATNAVLNGKSKSVSSEGVTPIMPPPRRAPSKASMKTLPTTPQASSKPDVSPLTLLFDGPVYSLGAFGIATILVGLSASIGVFGVQRSMGVNSVDEFATRMRQILLDRMPWLSRGIHHSGERTDLQDKPMHGDEAHHSGLPQGDGEWNWDAAEERLAASFESGGISSWAESAVQEMEEEAKIERKKRGL